MSYDQQGVEDASRALLEAIGEDINREGLRNTPARMGRAWRELLSGLEEDPREHLKTTFEVGTDEIVMVRDILLLRVRASPAAFLRACARGVHPQGRSRYRAVKACARRRRVCASPAGSGTSDSSDRRCHR